jgi:Kelch motif
VRQHKNKSSIKTVWPGLVAVGALAFTAGAVAVSIPGGPAFGAGGTSFTTVKSSANPVVKGVNFTVNAKECNRAADNPPTGTIKFKDATTGVSLGSVATTPDGSFVNCSDASVTDTESLAVGKYTIKASYHPSGATPAAPSSGHYTQKVIKPPFTDISWTQGTTVPNTHEEGAAVALGGVVYDISGATTDCSDGGCNTMQPAVDVYHPKTDTFTSAAPIPNPRAYDPAAVVVNGSIYVIGGLNTVGTVSAVDKYTPGKGWKTLPAASDLPSGFAGEESCGAAHGSKIYYFDSTAHEVGTLNTLTKPPSWTVGSPQPLLSPSSFCSAVTDGSKIVIVGPGDGSADSFSQRVLTFTPSTGAVTLDQGTTVPTAEQSAVFLHGIVVVAGGDFDYSAVEGVEPGGGSVASYSALPQVRDDAAGGSVVKGKFYIVGGQSVSNLNPHVMIGTPN